MSGYIGTSDQCSTCGEYVDPHADNHECQGAATERIADLEERMSAMEEAMQRLTEALSHAQNRLARVDPDAGGENAQAD